MYSFELHIQPTQWYNLLHDILYNISLDNINRWQFRNRGCTLLTVGNGATINFLRGVTAVATFSIVAMLLPTSSIPCTTLGGCLITSTVTMGFGEGTMILEGIKHSHRNFLKFSQVAEVLLFSHNAFCHRLCSFISTHRSARTKHVESPMLWS
jgi:hypothetical protein